MTTTIRAVLRDRDAALYLTGVVVSGFGTSALWLVSGVWVKDLTGSDGLAALCMLAMWAPTLAGPLLGTLADRFPRRPLLISSSLFLAALLPVLLAVDSPGLVWLVLGVLLVYGATGVVNDAAEAALVANTLPATLLGDFNGLRMAITEGMKLVSPLAGAGLYTLYGGPAVVLLDAATFVAAAGVYAGLRGGGPSAGRPEAGGPEAGRPGAGGPGAGGPGAGRPEAGRPGAGDSGAGHPGAAGRGSGGRRRKAPRSQLPGQRPAPRTRLPDQHPAPRPHPPSQRPAPRTRLPDQHPAPRPHPPNRHPTPRTPVEPDTERLPLPPPSHTPTPATASAPSSPPPPPVPVTSGPTPASGPSSSRAASPCCAPA
ncbi:MFS transporter [Streptomyces sp. ST1015]|uniref:MFS transporter n=1 Tax=Streptomyces sp. ST1015 TaxID=1848900 RepID=UPI00223BD062|nr:MFS transporter [Streptomyces sp. ST1015]